MALTLNIVIGSTRPGRIGPKVAAWFYEFAKENSKFDTVLVDLAEFDLPVYDEPKHPRLQQYEHAHTKRWAASVASADAFVFVTPEYNYFAPPALVNAISYLSKEWAYKPAGIVSYGGVSGGLRAAQSEKLLLTTLKVMPIPEGVPVQMVSQYVEEDGVFRPSDLIASGAKTMLDELHRWAEALKPMRA
ncbi:NAD(P)H-dependent oxidoreductase [Mesorhizobium sp. CN2-181]|uniref:NADPH-dependent FMN reductase n=1 Tax=Mesorhizobium yinganensis TaxID=3157707 RepID=UPI0032B84BE2